MAEADRVSKSVFTGGHALIIAVSTFERISALPEAVARDGRDVRDMFVSPDRCGYDQANVTLLVDDDANLAAIRGELASLAGRTSSSDTVVLYFSGHGARLSTPASEVSALVPFDYDPFDPEHTLLPEPELSAALAAIPAARLLVLIDACHSGAAGTFKGPTGLGHGFDEKSLAALATGRGRVLIASSRADEVSVVLDGARNSLFTENLLAALNGHAAAGGNGVIRVFEVFNYLAEQVRRANPDQHPILKASDVEDNFPVALHLGGQKGSASADAGRSSTAYSRDLENLMCDLYPSGPQDQEIWSRAGGDVSRLRLACRGRTDWFAALRVLEQGGGGVGIDRAALIAEALRDFPKHRELERLR